MRNGRITDNLESENDSKVSFFCFFITLIAEIMSVS